MLQKFAFLIFLFQNWKKNYFYICYLHNEVKIFIKILKMIQETLI